MDGFRFFFTRCIPLSLLLALGLGIPAYADPDDIHLSGLFELDTRAGVDGDQDKKNDPIPGIVGDANTTDDAAAGDDWANIYEDYTIADIPLVGPSSAFAISFIEDHFANGNIDNGAEPFVALRTPENTFFTGGGSKDTNGIQDGPWLYDTTNDQVPDKNDIVNAFAAAYVDDKGHTILYFGLDTYSVNGDSNAGFWFTRQDISLMPLEPGATTGSFVGEHEDGDIFVAVAYTEGGTVGDIDVYEWVGTDAAGSLVLIASGQGCESPTLVDGTATDADFDDDGDADVCGVINKLLPDEDFGEDPVYDYANTLVANNPLLDDSYKHESGALVEFGLDLNAILGDDIGCYSTFIAESRSSQSKTAQLKDFAFGDFDLCGVSVSKYCEAELNSAGNAANILFYGKTENIGAVDVVTTLEEDKGVFNVVCIDANENGRCGVVWDPAANSGAGGWVIGLLEVAPPSLSGLGTDTVSFNHGSGVVVAYEGSYTDSGPFVDDNPNGGPGFDFTDTIMATSVFGTDMVEDEATAVCSAVGTPDIEITKSCTNATIENYTTFVADISGTVENTGNVELVNVTFSDSTNDGAAATNFVYKRADNSTFPTDGSGTLAPGEVLTYTADVSSTTFTSHMNTITAYAENTFDSSDTVSDMATAPSGAEICSANPSASIDVTKDCATSGVDLVLDSGVLKIKVNMDVGVSNPATSNVALTGVKITDDEGGLAYVSGDVTFTCNTAGTECTTASNMDPGDAAVFTQSFFPDTLGTDILGTLTDPTTVDFQNTVDAEGTGLLGVGAVGDTDTDSCPLCECPDCPPAE